MFLLCISASIVPAPTELSVTAPNTQTVGQLLTLQCEVTTVRGITSRVDIVWSSDGTELERMTGVSLAQMENSLVYTDSYNISQLSTTDDDRVIQCSGGGRGELEGLEPPQLSRKGGRAPPKIYVCDVINIS